MSEGFDRVLRRELMSVARRRRRDRLGPVYLAAFLALLGAVALGLGESLLGRVALVMIALGLGAAYGARVARRILTDLSRSIDAHEL